jgi:hypothetical protein
MAFTFAATADSGSFAAFKGRIEGIGFKRHGDIAGGGSEFMNGAATDGDGPTADILKAGNHAQGRGFAAAG